MCLALYSRKIREADFTFDSGSHVLWKSSL
eukprot:SAG11_NODE_44452_length_155_cov_15.035714_1_plen_29_part_01